MLTFDFRASLDDQKQKKENMSKIDAEKLRLQYYQIAKEQTLIKKNQELYQDFLDSSVITYDILLPYLEQVSEIINNELSKLANYGDVELPFEHIRSNLKNVEHSLVTLLQGISHSHRKLKAEYLIHDERFSVGMRVLRLIIPALNHPSIHPDFESRKNFAIDVIFKNSVNRMIHQWILEGKLQIKKDSTLTLLIQQPNKIEPVISDVADEEIDLTLPRLPDIEEETQESMAYPLTTIESTTDTEETQTVTPFDPDETQSSASPVEYSNRTKN